MANIETLLADTRYFAEASAPSTPASGSAALYVKTDGKIYLKNDAGTEYDLTTTTGGSGTATAVVSAGSVVSSTSFANTDLTFAVAASTSYVFEFHVYFFTNATSVGLRLAVNGPAGATGRFGIYIPTGPTSDAVAIGNRQATALDTSLRDTVTGPGGSPVYAIVSGSMVIAGTAGNLVLRHASETATSTTIEAGSWGMLVQV